MRRLTKAIRDERGATATLVALMLIPLLGFAALAIDVGALYFEKAQLQNGADSAALRLAVECAESGGATCSAGGEVAAPDADANASDGVATLAAPTYGSYTVTATTTTLETDGATAIRHPLAALIGVDSTSVAAEATATWDGIGGGYTFPFSVSACQADPIADPGIIGDGTHRTIRFDTEPDGKVSELDCDIAKNGHVIDGGFGWLDTVSKDDCRAYSSIADGAVIEPGVAVPNGCKDDLDDAVDSGRIVYLPVHYGEQAHKTYEVRIYVGFRITGYKVSGGERIDPLASDPVPKCKSAGSDCRFIQGEFVEAVTSDPGMEAGGPDQGAQLVRLIG